MLPLIGASVLSLSKIGKISFTSVKIASILVNMRQLLLSWRNWLPHLYDNITSLTTRYEN